jgi:hypothetical protein
MLSLPLRNHTYLTPHTHRTNTRPLPSITYEPNTTLSFISLTPTAIPFATFDVQFHFLPAATFDTLPGFHTRYTVYPYVSKGSILLTINVFSSTITPASGEVLIPPWTPHRWEVLGGCETVVLERTEPRDGRKEAFFRNFVSLIND